MESIRAEVPDMNINVWYLNDVTLCGSPAYLAAALEIIEHHGPSRGLFLNRSKSLLHILRLSTFSCNLLQSDVLNARDVFLLRDALLSLVSLPLCAHVKSYEGKRSSESPQTPGLTDENHSPAPLSFVPQICFLLENLSSYIH